MAKTKKSTNLTGAWYALAIARILLGLTFLWAFFDKLFGLGASTPVAKSWLHGGSPTAGFLKGVQGPFADLFHTISGHAWANWLFMLGLLGIGTALLFGVAVRLAATAGFALLFMMWMASLPIKTNPVIDDHLIYATVLVTICYGLSEQKWSLAGWWQKLSFVRQNRWLW